MLGGRAATQVEGYRGRIEAELLLGRYSDAVGDYARVTAFVLPFIRMLKPRSPQATPPDLQLPLTTFPL